MLDMVLRRVRRWLPELGRLLRRKVLDFALRLFRPVVDRVRLVLHVLRARRQRMRDLFLLRRLFRTLLRLRFFRRDLRRLRRRQRR